MKLLDSFFILPCFDFPDKEKNKFSEAAGLDCVLVFLGGSVAHVRNSFEEEHMKRFSL